MKKVFGWKLEIQDQDSNQVFSGNNYDRFIKGWDVFNIQIKPQVKKLKITFKKRPSKKKKTINNYCYFFDSEGTLLKQENLDIILDKKFYEKIFMIEVPNNSVWLNLSIDPNENSGIFRIPGIYSIEENTKEKENIIFGLREFKYTIDNVTTTNEKIKNFFICSKEFKTKTFSTLEKNLEKKDLFKNIEEFEKDPEFIPKDTNIENSSYFTISEFYPKVNQHLIINPFSKKYLYISFERNYVSLIL